ncbi:MAG: hypothetical protein BRC43_08740, partial [Cyanobacteria bacterium QS_3_48_167]
ATSRGHRQCQLPSLPPALNKWWQQRDVSYGIFLPILAYLNKIEPWWFVLKNGISGGMNWSAFAMV